MKMIQTYILFLLAALSVQAARMSFDESWQFTLGDPKGAEQVAFADSDWRVLDVPHDWSIEGEYSKAHRMGDKGGYLPAGIGWYRKTIVVPQEWKGKYVEIAFDGVFMNSTVWANGQKLGTRPYGWSSFAYDISEIVESSGSITFAVRVDNSKQPAARWYTGSGIYAHTWIDVKDKIHVPADGVFVRTQGEAAAIDVELKNTTGTAQSVGVEVVIIDPSGNEVTKEQRSVMVNTDAVQASDFSFQVSNPQRWDIDSPHLYRAVTKVVVAGTVVDTTTTRFGFRDVEWKPDTGMWLNGKNIKLQGVCNHQDAGALGAAVPDKVLRFRIEQLKAMGCNAIRTAHNPQTPTFYDICDEVGMLVMDEIFDGWSKKANHDYGRYHFQEWWERDLTDWIKRDRNHPSIVIYSVGNETHGKVGEDLVALCHELDPTRPVTSGHSSSEYMDVFGVNGASEKTGWFDNLETDRVFIGTENPHTWQVRGYYRTKTWYRNGYPSRSQKPYEIPDLTQEEVFSYDWIDADGRSNRKQIFNSSYDNATVRLTARHSIEQLRDIPNYAGSFRWTGHDYIGEAGYVHGGWPFRAFMGGAIDLANFEKDLFYLYQSQWTDEPMVHILPHWTHPTLKLGTEIPVWVYSNCDEVELFLNGKSLGKQGPGTQWDAMQCEWMVGWQPGELKAIAYKDGKPVCEKIIRTADAPARIALSIDGEPLAKTGKDIVQVRVTTQDAKEEFYPYGENRTAFHVIGPGQIRALDNGSPVDVEQHFRAKDRIAFYGLTRAYVESTGAAGDITLLASCILGEKRQISSELVSIDAQLLSLRGTLAAVSVEIFYTLDGSTPTTQSTRYTKAFAVPLGTTVKALVALDGQPVQILEERFAADEGFVWNVAQDASHGGDQAEDAKLSGAVVSTAGKGFNGKGFVDFGNNKGAYVEWYQENDGDAGEADLTIRYSGKARGASGRAIQLSINGKVIDKQRMLPNTKDWGSDWQTVTVPIRIGRGANTIRLSTVENGGMYIDEISVR
ncbi:glycoside hydrolase family 2 TIM barrel-domain containing protein [Coraliomargarita algicola]|uniref:Glycoside hydrolase family 2 TIM barrel-domain containing protein n=1 Tax=Coraliomargarita algicola TaxID=3092156 RepID=A0ABZ0RLM0_9BACT|nr:glycoside hydrolase family 2 TIM barrel-domain containing protein [Coraliomargarita sp. J2-16]WPJ95983.1 glycoside hydrolase family 2 TIM barrel-domain containing protein [Coraliomargarita sp. J2-16]